MKNQTMPEPKEVPLDKTHKKMLKKLKVATKKHEKHTGRRDAAALKMQKFNERIETLNDAIAEYVEGHLEVEQPAKKQAKRAS